MCWQIAALVAVCTTLTVVTGRHHHHLSPFQSLPLDNDVPAGTTPYDCLEMPGSFESRLACCAPLTEHHTRMPECIATQRKLERQLGQKIVRRLGISRGPLRRSLFDCFVPPDAVNSSRNAGDEYQHRAAAVAATAADLTAYREATIQVIGCTFGAEAERWSPIVKRAFDVCHRQLMHAEALSRRAAIPQPSGCAAVAVDMLFCMQEQMFAECPADVWANGDGGDNIEECDAWREHDRMCPHIRMRDMWRVDPR